MTVEPRVALVTGATQGLGLALVHEGRVLEFDRYVAFTAAAI